MPIIFNIPFPWFTLKKWCKTAPQHCVVYWVYWIEYANYFNSAIFHQRSPRRGRDGKNWQKLHVLTTYEANERRKMKEANENSVAKASSSSASMIVSGALQRIPQLGEPQGNTETWQKTTAHVTTAEGTWARPEQRWPGPAMDQRNSRNSQPVQENRLSSFCGSWHGMVCRVRLWLSQLDQGAMALTVELSGLMEKTLN